MGLVYWPSSLGAEMAEPVNTCVYYRNSIDRICTGKLRNLKENAFYEVTMKDGSNFVGLLYRLNIEKLTTNVWSESGCAGYLYELPLHDVVVMKELYNSDIMAHIWRLQKKIRDLEM